MLHSIPIFTDTDDTKFGWFIGRNGTIGADGVYNMKTTAGDDFATLTAWNYKNHSSFFSGRCGQIYGSGGEIFPRHVKPTFISLFSAEMCRTAQLNYVKNETVNGIFGYKFSVGDQIFDNGSKLHENICYDNIISDLNIGLFTMW